MIKKQTPNPGSEEAIKMGCKCPVMDNGHGGGVYIDLETMEPVFWISESCPVHFTKDEK